MYNWVVFEDLYRPCPLVGVRFWRRSACLVYFYSAWYFAHSRYIITVFWINEWISEWALFVFHLTAASESTYFFHFYCRKVLYQTYAVESLNVIEGGNNTALGHQPASWDHSPPMPGKEFPLSPPFWLSKALGLLSHTFMGGRSTLPH